jgi:addiction module HigA family antidote
MLTYNPAHPGAILQDHLEGQSRSLAEIATRLWVDPATLSSILQEQASVTSEMSRKLGELLGTSPQFWYRLQSRYDKWQESKQGIAAPE